MANQAIKEDKNGLKLKYSISLAGGSGNLEKPWIMKATPSPNLSKKWEKIVTAFNLLLNWKSKYFKKFVIFII